MSIKLVLLAAPADAILAQEDTYTELVFPPDARHLELVEKANRSVEEARLRAESDIL